MYRKATDFCILILNPAILFNLFTIFRFFFFCGNFRVFYIVSHGDVTSLVSFFTAINFSLRIAFFESFNFLRYIYLFMVALCLGCCLSAFSNFRAKGLLSVALHGLLIAVVSLVVEHGL